MAIKCKGCGIALQVEHPDELGYSPKKEAEYCQRCFRMTHYDDVKISMKQGIDEDQVMEQAAKTKGLIVWVLDCFDLEAGMLKGMRRHFIGRDVILALTKCDLLPKTVTKEKLQRFLKQRCKEWQFEPVAMAIVHQGNKEDLQQLQELIELHRKNGNVLFMGKANAGKSTLLNGLLNNKDLTVTRYPGTTLDFNEINCGSWQLIDTPGLLNKQSLLFQVQDSDLKAVVPDSRIKPQVFQLWENQSFAIGGLCRVDCFCTQSSSVIFYVSNRLTIHRGRQDRADELWQRHQGALLQPSTSEAFDQWHSFTFDVTTNKLDLCIHGLGWVSVFNTVDRVCITVPSNVTVTARKAMI